MTTSRVESALDYKSAKAIDAVANTMIKRAHLRDAVVEAAKAEHIAFDTFRANTTTDNWQSACDASDKRREAVDVLIEFESLQEKKG